MKPGSRLDRWLARTFVGAYCVGLCALLVLFMVLNTATSAGELSMEDGGGLARVLMGFLIEVPDLHRQAAPFLSMGAGLFTAARLMTSREWVAVVMAGISSRRLFLPVVVAGAALSLGSWSLRETISPWLGKVRLELGMGTESTFSSSSVGSFWVRTRSGSAVHVGACPRSAEGAEGHVLDDVELPIRLEGGWGILRAEQAQFSTSGWQLEGGRLERVTAEGRFEVTEAGQHEALDFQPADVLLAMRAQAAPRSLTGREAATLLERDPSNATLRTMASAQTAAPWLELLFLVVALPFAVRPERNALLRGILQAVLVCAGLFMFSYLLQSLGMQGEVDPKPAAWIPVAVAALGGAFTYTRQRT